MDLDAVRYHLRNIRTKLDLPDLPAVRRWEGRPMTTPPQPAGARAGITGIVQVSLLVSDLDRAVGFYRDVLGLPHLLTAGDMAFFDVTGVRLYLHATAAPDWRPGSVIYLSVTDMDSTVHELAAHGVELTGAPHRVHTHPDGTEEWMAFFEDGQGNTLGLLARTKPTPAL